jgi:hypothetical protein
MPQEPYRQNERKNKNEAQMNTISVISTDKKCSPKAGGIGVAADGIGMEGYNPSALNACEKNAAVKRHSSGITKKNRGGTLTTHLRSMGITGSWIR